MTTKKLLRAAGSVIFVLCANKTPLFFLFSLHSWNIARDEAAAAKAESRRR